MRIKVVLLSFCVFLFLAAIIKPVFATCPSQLDSHDVLSSCALEYILNTNISAMGSMLIGNPNEKNSFNQSAAGVISNGIQLLASNQPASLGQYISYLGQRFHIPGTPTISYAAGPTTGGLGYTSLSPLLPIWTAMRNLAYLLFAVIFIVIGIMIMIRSKVDPKTVLTVQSALPKIVITLIIVTFSYAIAGFMIDLMYVTISLVLLIASSISGPEAISDIKSNVLGGQSIFTFFLRGPMWFTISSSSAAVGSIVDSFVKTVFGNGGTGGLVQGQIAGFISSGLAFLIIAVAIVFSLFKTWLMLISAYANAILGIIFSPVQLAFDAIPGQNQLDGWIRNMLANLLAFPAVITMILIAFALSTNFGNGITPGDTAIGFTPPLLGGGGLTAFQSLIGLALILTTPKVVEMLQDIIKAPKQKWGTAWGEAVSRSRDFNWAAAKATPNIPGVKHVREEAQEKIRSGAYNAWERNIGPNPPGILQPKNQSKSKP